MPATPKHCAIYRRKLKERAMQAVGRTCVFCGDTPVDMAHVKPTAVKGSGRGMIVRYRDVLRNSSNYRPMCRHCHKIWDALIAFREVPF